jgi:flagellar hook protein FlgE
MPFRIALSGLNAAQTDLAVTGNNIANSSTVGFKQSRTEFADVYAVAFEGISDIATGNGVAVSAVSQNFSQGNIDFTDRSLDIAISGQGFFVLGDNTGHSYSRAGAFHVDRDGFVVNQNGQRLQIFEAVSGGGFNTGKLDDLELSTTEGPPSATDLIDVSVNLSSAASQPVTVPFNPNDATSFNNSTSTVVYDSLGTAHTATLYYVKTATANEWDSYLYIDGNEIDSGGVSPTTLIFNPDGTINTPTSIAYDNYTPSTGALDISIDMNYSDSTQFGSPFAVNGLSQNGFTTGRLSGIDINDEGVVFARYTNGQSNPLGKIALANFSNVSGLRQLGDTSWAQSFDAGDVLLGEAGTSSFGYVQAGGLESSNVDIAESLVNLITAQRNFQANAQVISAADTITQTIINI